MADGYSRVVFVKFTEQGSTVLAYDAIRRAAERVGRENVFVIVFEENRFILELLEVIPPRNVMLVRSSSGGSMLASALGVLWIIRRRRVDACVDLEFLSRSTAAFSYLTGARWRSGFHAGFGGGPSRGDLFTHRVNYNPHVHASRAFTSLVYALELDPAQLPALLAVPDERYPLPRFKPSVAEKTEMQEILAERGCPAGARLILLNANAGDLLPLRRWPGLNYVDLARRLVRALPGAFIVFTGAKLEAPAVDALVVAVDSPRCVSLAGRTSLRQLLVLYGLSEVLVTNDSGPAHFAAMTPVDVMVLFGPETPALFAAENLRTHVFWAGLACSPCVNAYNNRQTACRNNLCMQGITVDQVFHRACQVFREKIRVRA